MKRFLTVIAATATLGGVTAPAAMAQQGSDMSMLTGQVYRALRDCEIDTNVIDTLTMAQVAGITLTASSSDAADTCGEIESIVRGSEE
ncbi:hypothetical protein [Palleronia sp. LCG004]|uniref:hypothetical protein n=1 Tax=Palleronia sp. LCG004 TaxID=3079304 RepID=UPI002941F11E|nr:hypothetical protein [Palleronia sp. LCG004]WOI55537.1 hypothetical protein RVY76_10840 [Palleronia sp. LCG004]